MDRRAFLLSSGALATIGIVPGALAQTFVTQFAKLRGSGKRVPSAHYLRYLRVITASSLLIAFATATVKPYLVRVVFGNQYAFSTSLVDLGLIAIILGTVKQALLVGLIAERRTGYASLDSIVNSGAGAIVGNFLIPQLQAAGVLIGEVVGHLASFSILFVLLCVRVRGEGRWLEVMAVGGSLVVGVTMLLVSYFTRDTGAHFLPLAAGFTLFALSLPVLLFTQEERSKGRQELERLLRLRGDDSAPGD